MYNKYVAVQGVAKRLSPPCAKMYIYDSLVQAK